LARDEFVQEKNDNLGHIGLGNGSRALVKTESLMEQMGRRAFALIFWVEKVDPRLYVIADRMLAKLYVRRIVWKADCM